MMTKLITEWLELQEALREIERTSRPDIVDHYGRTWTWWQGELYRHCGMAWPKSSVLDTRNGLPCPTVRSNPNYGLCDICTGEGEA